MGIKPIIVQKLSKEDSIAVKISKRLIMFVGLLCIITLVIPSQVYCQAEGGSDKGAAGAAPPETGAAGAGTASGGAAMEGVSSGTIAISVGIVAAIAAIGIAAGGGGGGTTTTAHH